MLGLGRPQRAPPPIPDPGPLGPRQLPRVTVSSTRCSSYKAAVIIVLTTFAAYCYRLFEMPARRHLRRLLSPKLRRRDSQASVSREDGEARTFGAVAQ